MIDINNEMKKLAAIDAVNRYVTSGMTIGLGTGSTALHAVKYLSDKIISGHLTNIKGIATSDSTHQLAISLGIDVIDIDSIESIDLAIDGADEIDRNLNLIKGGGGALLREKIVELKAKKFIVIADENKLNKGFLGSKFPIPIEIVKYGHLTICKQIASILDLKSWKLRTHENKIYVTNNGNYIVDIILNNSCDLNEISDKLKDIVGVVCHGLFINMADECIICNKELKVHVLNKNNAVNYFT